MRKEIPAHCRAEAAGRFAHCCHKRGVPAGLISSKITGCFENMAGDLRKLMRVLEGREPDPSAAVMDSRTPGSTPESGERAGYGGYKRRKGSKVHIASTRSGTCSRCA